MDMMLRIGEIAAFFNVSVRALRLYEKKEIIRPAKIDAETGYRYYTADQVQQLNSLIELQSLGFTLSEIKAILSGKLGPKRLMELMVDKKSKWRDTISVAERKIDAIEEIEKRMKKQNDLSGLTEMTQEQRAWLLVKLVCVEDLRSQSILSEAIWL